jgi:hypothetical protein
MNLWDSLVPAPALRAMSVGDLPMRGFHEEGSIPEASSAWESMITENLMSSFAHSAAPHKTDAGPGAG